MEIFLSLELDPVRRSINILLRFVYFWSFFVFLHLQLLFRYLNNIFFYHFFSYLHLDNHFFLVKVLDVL